MAFPRTPVLDDFNTGANQPLATRFGWKNPNAAYDGEAEYTTNATPDAAVKVTPGGPNYCSMVWARSRFANGEIWFTVKTTPSGGSFYPAISNFYTQINSTGTIVKIQENVAGVDTTIASTTLPGGVLAGDSLGVSCFNLSVTIHHKRAAGEWYELLHGQGSDVAGYSPGVIVLEISPANDSEIDVFGGGPLLDRPFASWAIKASG